MSGSYLLVWAIIALSLFNAILLFWLGLTVLLNAERRTWGIWFSGGGLLMGAAFFVSHLALLSYGLDYVGRGTDFWWRVGWVPAITLPFAWYAVMLWYAGFWDDGQGVLRHRHRPWFLLACSLLAGLAGLFLLANPLPAFSRVARLDLAASPTLAGVPVVIVLYPLFIVLCVALSLDALRRPEPSARIMGDLARRRARPWLVATSVVLLLVSLLVAWAMLWLVSNARQRAVYDVYQSMSLAVAWIDLVISFLIALAVVLLGRAIVAYEVFTGQTLPRRGLINHWRRAAILAAGYGVAVGWILTQQLLPIYGLLLATALMTLFYALLSWRSFAERERYMEHLRPFVSSPRLHQHLLAPAPSSALDLEVKELFQALCNDVLGARLAHLIPLNPLTSTVGNGLSCPEDLQPPQAPIAELLRELGLSRAACLPLDPANYAGATWAVPLRSEQALIGILLLGDKRDGGLYTLEEIEIAQASGERLIDTMASTELARRLVALQRQRLAESRDYGELSRAVFDQRARRLLHDEVLPLLHTAMLTMSAPYETDSESTDDPLSLLAEAHRQISDLLCQMPVASAPEINGLGLAGALREVVTRDLAGAFDKVTWQVDEEAASKAEALSPLQAEVLFYAAREAIRNAARHSRDQDGGRPLSLLIALSLREIPDGSGHQRLELLVEDDGVGLKVEDPLAKAGGQGLALHSTMIAVVGGAMAMESVRGLHTRVLLTLPAQ